MNSKPTYEEAHKLLSSQIGEEKRVDKCIQANICPECGAQLHKKNILFGLWFKFICPNGHRVTGLFSSYDGE